MNVAGRGRSDRGENARPDDGPDAEEDQNRNEKNNEYSLLVLYIEKNIGCPITNISVGAARDEIIRR